MESSPFLIYVGGVEVNPLIKESMGRFLVVQSSDLLLSSSNNPITSIKLFAILHSADKIDELLPLEPSGLPGQEPYYVLDKQVSIEYLVYQDLKILSKASSEQSNFRGKERLGVASNDHIDLTGPQSPGPVPIASTTSSSVVKFIISNIKTAQSLKKKLIACNTIEIVEEIPDVYDGNVAFELPPLINVSQSKMSGMEQACDGHPWTKPRETSHKFPGTVRISHCAGALFCNNSSCGALFATGSPNRISWRGKLIKNIEDVGISTNGYGSLACFYCKSHPILEATCNATVYYIMPDDPTMSRLMIHEGSHCHQVQRGSSRLLMQNVRDSVKEVIKDMESSGPRKIQMCVAKKLVLQCVQRKHCKEGMNISPMELSDILKEVYPIIQTPRFKKWVHEAKGDEGMESKILDLKRTVAYEFFHGSRFPGQCLDDDERCFVFKMSTTGEASGVDLVNRMRRTGNGDLRRSWVCFDHVRRCAGWTTMAAHVYDPGMQDLQTIATCEMKEEDTSAQILFWSMLNDLMVRKGFEKADFFGFMSDEAGANWCAVRSVFNEGNHMGERERSCLFHWEQSLDIHTSKYVVIPFQDEHKKKCRMWRCASNEEEALSHYRRIRAWWSTGKVADGNIPAMDCWLSWWHVRYHHWKANLIGKVNDDIEHMPRTNLAESKHASWLAGEGFKGTITLYNAAVSDLLNALLQSTKKQAFLEGKYHGSGPGIAKLQERGKVVEIGGAPPTPAGTSKLINAALENTNLQQTPIFMGDNVTVRRKRTLSTINVEDEDSSHRPEYVTVNVPRKTRARKLSFNTPTSAPQPQASEGNISAVQVEGALETSVHKTFWAIRRTDSGSKVECQGFHKSETGKCKKKINKGSKARPAPCFWGLKTFPKGEKHGWVWCCPDNVECTWEITSSVKGIIPRRPAIWPVDIGVGLTNDEVQDLYNGGYEVQKQLLNEGSSSKTRYRTGISKLATVNIEKALELSATLKDNYVIKTGIHEQFIVESIDSGGTYTITVAKNHACSCLDFQGRAAEGLTFTCCKHMYFVYLRVLGLDVNHNMFIHQRQLTTEDLARVLGNRRTNN